MLTNTKNYPCYLCNKHHTSKSWDRALLATWNECSLPFKSKLETERKMLSDAELLNSPREVTEHFSKMGSDLKSIQALWHSLSKAPYAHSQDKRLISLKEEQHREPDSLGEERKCLQTQLSINRFLPPPHQLRFVCQCKKKKRKKFPSTNRLRFNKAYSYPAVHSERLWAARPRFVERPIYSSQSQIRLWLWCALPFQLVVHFTASTRPLITACLFLHRHTRQHNRLPRSHGGGDTAGLRLEGLSLPAAGFPHFLYLSSRMHTQRLWLHLAIHRHKRLKASLCSWVCVELWEQLSAGESLERRQKPEHLAPAKPHLPESLVVVFFSLLVVWLTFV